jgi:alanine racemase
MIKGSIRSLFFIAQAFPDIHYLISKEICMSVSTYPNWIEINLSAVEHNVKYILESTRKPLMAVVKAEAYGHGAVEVGKAALHAGATWLAVARFCEARVLREAGIQSPILVLGMVTPGEVDEAIASKVTLTMHSYEMADLYSERGKQMGKPALAHLKVDTGMGRLGVFTEDIVPFARYANDLGGISIDGMYSHFAMATEGGHPLTPLQTERFKQAVKSLREANILPKWVHMANSAGTYYEPDSHFNLVRAGSAVVGLQFRDDAPYPNTMRRSFAWKTRLASCKEIPAGWGIGYGQTYTLEKDEIIGVIPVGYGDGYRRKFHNEVLIDGQRVPVVGTECMDQTMIRLPKKYPYGTEVVLIGTQGKESIYVEDICKKWNTIEVDVTTLINQRVPRVYVRD